jgi:hypothetical protein
VKLQGEEQVPEPPAIGGLPAETLQVERHGRIAPDGHQLPREPGSIGGSLQGVPGPRALHVVHVGQDAFEAPEALQQLGRRLLPDPAHARDIVRAVADESQVVGHLGRWHAQPLGGVVRGHPLGIHSGGAAPPGVQEPGMVVDELVEVLVPGDDDRLEPCLLGLGGQRPDHVVRLPALSLDDGHPERLDQLPTARQGGFELVRHLLARRLVLGVHLGPEAVTRVEHDRQVIGPVVVQHVDEEAREAVGRGGVLPLRGGERAADHRIERPVDEGVAVDQVEDRAVELGDGYVVHGSPDLQTVAPRAGSAGRGGARTERALRLRRDSAVRLGSPASREGPCRPWRARTRLPAPPPGS